MRADIITDFVLCRAEGFDPVCSTTAPIRGKDEIDAGGPHLFISNLKCTSQRKSHSKVAALFAKISIVDSAPNVNVLVRRVIS